MSVVTRIEESVTTYADGYGRWYARIDFSPEVDTLYVVAHGERLQAKARRHIRNELLRRGDIEGGHRVRLMATADLHQHAQIGAESQRSITYRER